VNEPVLALIPARAGSKQLTDKALRPFAGRPLIVHSIELAKRCPEIARVVVTTDSERIADVAREAGAEVPFLRPAELAEDDTPMWPVVRHALTALEAAGATYAAVALLQPTSPARMPSDIAGAVQLLGSNPNAEGVVAVSEPHHNPIWSAMVERDGFLKPLFSDGAEYVRRQDVPRVWNVNGVLYLWRTAHVIAHVAAPAAARYLALEIPKHRAFDIDSLEDLEQAEALVEAGAVKLPWLE
jgi:N-acylneuraminate cytidylyltransferase